MAEHTATAKSVAAVPLTAARLSFALAAAFVVSFVSVGVMVSQSGGTFGPDVLVGWPNRIEIVAYSVWLMAVSWQAIRMRETRVPGFDREEVLRRGDDRPAEGGR